MKKIQHGGYSVGIMTALPSLFLKSHVIWKLVKKKKKNLIQKMVFNWQYLYKLGQIYKTSLRVNPEFWGCFIFGATMSHSRQLRTFLEKPLT